MTPGIADEILDAVSMATGIGYRSIMSASRLRKVARARQLAMWCVFKLRDYSYPRIGRMFGRDHTTVMYAVKAIEASPELRQVGQDIVDRLRPKIEAREAAQSTTLYFVPSEAVA